MDIESTAQAWAIIESEYSRKVQPPDSVTPKQYAEWKGVSESTALRFLKRALKDGLVEAVRCIDPDTKYPITAYLPKPKTLS